MTRLSIAEIRIGNLSDSSAVFSGTSAPSAWTNVRKIGEGLGTVSGDGNVLRGNRQMVIAAGRGKDAGATAGAERNPEFKRKGGRA